MDVESSIVVVFFWSNRRASIKIILKTDDSFPDLARHFSLISDAVYSRFQSYSVSMSFPAPLSLHHYFVVAARMQHHFESNLVAVEESGVAGFGRGALPTSVVAWS
jgi:hypothetical protein